MDLAKLAIFLLFVNFVFGEKQRRALQKSHEKSKSEKWMEHILGKKKLEYNNKLATLVTMISNVYLSQCVPVILYDKNTEGDDILLNQLFKESKLAVLHGQVTSRYKSKQRQLMEPRGNSCVSYVLFIKDVMKSERVIGIQTSSKVVIVTESSQWRVNEFLNSELSRNFINLLIVSPSSQNPVEDETYILYTHKLYTDGLGSSAPVVLTSWRNNIMTRPWVSLFPQKIKDGFSGHRFITSLAIQPPFVIRRGLDENDDIMWDGSEIRLLNLLSELYNFTTDFKLSKSDSSRSSADTVIESIREGKANVGLSGIYVTDDRLSNLDMTYPHTQDCAAFVSLASTALPRYKAIMGPFHWSVWLTLTITYLLAIIPLAFADKHTLRHLIETPQEIENMFWYVFGTFTNCFSFGKDSWTKSDKVSPRVFMGFYWIFTTIITACYTGSIIAFITLPVYPITTDTIRQFLYGRYQTGTLDKGGWEYWFQNSSDPDTARLLKNVELLPNVESGLKNTTRAFFWPYAFLGSRDQLDYIVRTNFTTGSKRSLLHISSECFVPFGVSIVFSKNSEYKDVINKGIARIVQSGFMLKFRHDIEWEVMRSSTGKLLQASSGNSLKYISVDDRSLTLDDTQGIFLLLGAGFLMGAAALMSEMLGGCLNCCKRRRLSIISLKSNPRSYDQLTPRDKLYSIQYQLNEILLNNIPLNSPNSENSQNCIVHPKPSSTNSTESGSTDFETEINKIFNFDELFGDENCLDSSVDEEFQ